MKTLYAITLEDSDRTFYATSLNAFARYARCIGYFACDPTWLRCKEDKENVLANEVFGDNWDDVIVNNCETLALSTLEYNGKHYEFESHEMDISAVNRIITDENINELIARILARR